MADEEYMELAPGVGVIEPAQRNQGYKKLGWNPGDGGLGSSDPGRAEGGDAMQAFLAGVASGADPKQLAKELSGSTSSRRRGR
jgi:hypothetical protein